LATPDSDAWRTVASVPRRSGAYSLSIFSVSSAWPSGVRWMSSTLPAGMPETCTRLPLTICDAFSNRASTV
jgi:hypothetical protein